MHGTSGASGVIDDLEQGREQFRPVIGEIGASDLTDGETGRRLDLALLNIRRGAQLQQDATDLGLVGVIDEDLAAEFIQ